MQDVGKMIGFFGSPLSQIDARKNKLYNTELGSETHPCDTFNWDPAVRVVEKHPKNDRNCIDFSYRRIC